jgi:hypothetical protein
VKIKELQSYDNQDQKKEKKGKKEKRVKFQLIGPLGKIHNIIVYIRGSTAYITEFLKLAKRQILLNNHTR